MIFLKVNFLYVTEALRRVIDLSFYKIGEHKELHAKYIKKYFYITRFNFFYFRILKIQLYKYIKIS